MTNTPFMTKKKFSEMVETTVFSKRMSYMDAIIFICEQNNIEIIDSKKYITPRIKSKVEVEAMDLNFIPKRNTLF